MLEYACSLLMVGWLVGWLVGRLVAQPSHLVPDERVSIRFDGVYMNSDTYINGIFLGNHPCEQHRTPPMHAMMQACLCEFA